MFSAFVQRVYFRIVTAMFLATFSLVANGSDDVPKFRSIDSPGPIATCFAVLAHPVVAFRISQQTSAKKTSELSKDSLAAEVEGHRQEFESEMDSAELVDKIGRINYWTNFFRDLNGVAETMARRKREGRIRDLQDFMDRNQIEMAAQQVREKSYPFSLAVIQIKNQELGIQKIEATLNKEMNLVDRIAEEKLLSQRKGELLKRQKQFGRDFSDYMYAVDLLSSLVKYGAADASEVMQMDRETLVSASLNADDTPSLDPNVRLDQMKKRAAATLQRVSLAGIKKALPGLDIPDELPNGTEAREYYLSHPVVFLEKARQDLKSEMGTALKVLATSATMVGPIRDFIISKLPPGTADWLKLFFKETYYNYVKDVYLPAIDLIIDAKASIPEKYDMLLDASSGPEGEAFLAAFAGHARRGNPFDEIYAYAVKQARAFDESIAPPKRLDVDLPPTIDIANSSDDDVDAAEETDPRVADSDKDNDKEKDTDKSTKGDSSDGDPERTHKVSLPKPGGKPGQTDHPQKPGKPTKPAPGKKPVVVKDDPPKFLNMYQATALRMIAARKFAMDNKAFYSSNGRDRPAQRYGAYAGVIVLGGTALYTWVPAAHHFLEPVVTHLLKIVPGMP